MKVFKRMLPNADELKLMVLMGLIMVVFFGSIAVFRAIEIDPLLDDVYSEIYGLNGEGEEW